MSNHLTPAVLQPNRLQLFKCLLWLAPFLFLWQVLLRHLSIEWTFNPQYRFGWGIPPVCLYLLWRSLRQLGIERSQSLSKITPDAELVCLGLFLCVGYAFVRLIQEANPDWRFVSWALALDVIGLTFVGIEFLFQLRPISNLKWPRFWISVFPFLFFLVSVPWPTVIERPIIGCLTQIVAAGAAELLGVMNIPAVLHANLIEVGSGTIGIDEACSGIRSLQASVVISLFFGEVSNLGAMRRVLLIVAGVVSAIVLNLLRATVLAVVAARNGFAGVSTWHDPLSVMVPCACFLGIWGLASILKRRSRRPTSDRPLSGFLTISVLCANASPSALISLSLALWIGAVEIGTETWYRHCEKRLPGPVHWQINPPREQLGFRRLPFPVTTRQILRFDEGINATWFEGNNLRWQAIFLRWDPARTSAYLARNHTPEDCLAAVGGELASERGLHIIGVHGLEMPFRTYITYDEGRALYVFYCLWEDRAISRTFNAEWLNWHGRMTAVFAGHRNSGQRSLELALWGAENEQEAQTALRRVLNQIVSVTD